MAPKFVEEVDAWAERFQARVNDSEEFDDAAAGFDAVFRFLVVPDEVYDGDPVALTVLVQEGTCVAAAGNDPDAVYDFSLTGPYAAWRDLLADEIDLVAAVTGGPFDFEGSRAELLEHREAVEELVRCARDVATEFDY